MVIMLRRQVLACAIRLQLRGEAVGEEGVTICNNNNVSDIGKSENKPSASAQMSEQVLG